MIANESPRLFVENVEKDRCVGSIFGNQFHFLLMNNQQIQGVPPASLRH
jgi:hypothetical protein